MALDTKFIKTCFNRIASPFKSECLKSVSQQSVIPRACACVCIMLQSSSSSCCKEKSSFTIESMPLSIRLISKISLISPNKYCEVEVSLATFPFILSGILSFIAMSAVVPTMAFIGVRISWLIRERNSLFALLSASAFAIFFCILAFFTRMLAIITITIVMSSKKADIAVIDKIGLVSIKLFSDTFASPIETRLWSKREFLSSSDKLLMPLLIMDNSSGFAGIGTAKLMLIRFVDKVTGTTLV